MPYLFFLTVDDDQIRSSFFAVLPSFIPVFANSREEIPTGNKAPPHTQACNSQLT